MTELPIKKKIDRLISCYKNNLFDEAEKLAGLITKEQPEHLLSWKMLVALYGQSGKYKEALQASQKALSLNSDDAQANSNHGNILCELGEFSEAVKFYRIAISLDAHYGEAFNNLGVALFELQHFQEAEDAYRRSLELNENYLPALKNLSKLKGSFGKIEEASLIYNKILSINPKDSYAHYHLTKIKPFTSQNKHYHQMESFVRDQKFPDHEKCYLFFALAKACEDLGDVGKAFNYYKNANELRKKSLNYNVRSDREIFFQLTEAYSKIYKSRLTSNEDFPNYKPVFIVGMPRSGTSIVEQILSSHSKIRGLGELDFVNKFGENIARGLIEPCGEMLQIFRRNYMESLIGLSGGYQILVDKMPQNFRYIGLITSAFPEAKIIHVTRSPEATCWGNFKQYFVSYSMNYSYSLNDIVEYYFMYKSLMNFWVNEVSDRIYHVDYDLLTEKQEQETKKLIRFLNIDWEANCLSPHKNYRSVKTASGLQIRERLYSGSSSKWKQFKPFLNGAFDPLKSLSSTPTRDATNSFRS